MLLSCLRLSGGHKRAAVPRQQARPASRSKHKATQACVSPCSLFAGAKLMQKVRTSLTAILPSWPGLATCAHTGCHCHIAPTQRPCQLWSIALGPRVCEAMSRWKAKLQRQKLRVSVRHF